MTGDKQNPYHILMSPTETTFVIVDHQRAFTSCFDKQALRSAQQGIRLLAAQANELGIPIITSMVETNTIKAELFPSLNISLSKATVVKRKGFNPWEEEAFADTLKQIARPKLLIAGLSSETSLTFTALCALEEGFDTYVVKDACLGRSPESVAMTFDRLTQAGVVPVSWRQVLIEWKADIIDTDCLQHLGSMKQPS